MHLVGAELLHGGARLAEYAQQLGQQEGVTPGYLGAGRDHVRARTPQRPVHDLRHGLVAHGGEPQFTGLAAQGEEGLLRVGLLTVRGGQEQRDGAADEPVRRVGEETHRGGVGGVGVVDDEEEGRALGELGDQPVQGVVRRVRTGRGRVERRLVHHEPRRRAGQVQQRLTGGLVGLREEVAEHLAHHPEGEIPLQRSTACAAHEDGDTEARAGEGPDQRRLADARLADEVDQRRVAGGRGAHGLTQCVQFPRASCEGERVIPVFCRRTTTCVRHTGAAFRRREESGMAGRAAGCEHPGRRVAVPAVWGESRR